MITRWNSLMSDRFQVSNFTKQFMDVCTTNDEIFNNFFISTLTRHVSNNNNNNDIP